MKDILMMLRLICERLDLIVEVQKRAAELPLKQRKRWTKQEVIDELKMSDSTYKRNIRNELLKPIRLSGFDEYFDEDLIKAMDESRRRGRV